MDEYHELIGCLPLETIDYAFAYGSGALQQANENKSEKMVDFVLVTNDALRFHTDNLQRNSGHYSLTGGFKQPRWVTNYQTKWAARILYNTQVQGVMFSQISFNLKLSVGSRMIKYGVISTEDLQQDLLDWKWLYTAGRLQKPVLDMIKPSQQISVALLENRKSALHAALLLLPDLFSPEDLYEKIVGLSYNGDIRMQFRAEDPEKIKKIVKGSIDRFHEVYSPLLESDVRLVHQNDSYLQDASGTAIYHRLHMLPSTPLDILTKRWNKQMRGRADCEEVLFGMAHRHDVAPTVERAISSIVWRSSISQTLKNIPSAGFRKGISYLAAKLVKGLRR